MPLPTLIDALEASHAFTRLRSSLPAPGNRLAVGGLVGSADAVAIAALARNLATRVVIVVADAIPEAERWWADLRVLLDDATVALYPAREGFGEAEPHAEIAGERVETLERLTRGEVRILLTTARAAMERSQVPRTLAAARLELRRGDVRRLSDLAAHLDGIGFERVTMVDDVAQYAVRGGIVDIYSFGMAEPVRLELMGDTIADLRAFDIVTQRSTRALDATLILPAEMAARDDEASAERLSIVDLWPPDSIVVLPRGAHPEPEMERTWSEAAHHLDLARRRGEDAAPREDLFLDPKTAQDRLARFATVALVDDPAAAVRFPLLAPEAISRDIRRLRRVVRDGVPTIILCDNAGQAERLDELLNEDEYQPSPAALSIGVLDGGFVIPAGTAVSLGGFRGLRILTDHEIFRRERRLRRARRYGTGALLETITGVKPGDFVVHLEHGVGIFRGIQQIFVNESTIEVAVIEYEGGDRLNVPLYRIDQIERYRAARDMGEDTPPPRLHKLGGKRWSQQRERTRVAIEAMTQELLDLYARRQIASRPPHVPDTPWQRQLESSFLFEDTPDQVKATADVKADLERARPMDRLLVGDVGYGKTEIAVRAAFKAIQSDRQVAVLVPTTILADQHARTFGERLADFPVRIAALSRFQTAKEQAEIVRQIAAKQLDVVIGTHRLLSSDIAFGGLGLLIIDEEHRFGVKHKERLKQLRLETDVLTLTATPIPRTLHMSLAGLRDMTLMQTPPRDRSPVLTFVEPWDDGLISEGISRELDRGGQVFFVHNRVETIEAISDHVRRLVPRARIAVGHGQMRERDLEDVMHRFARGELDILVSTMIVESGLDVPNANTMFVNRADYFGLAQLYQLRGRVGRSHRRAYCYLMVPDLIDEDAERRLRVLEHHTELGSGYRIALTDLELRGAGNLLGPEQSGFVHAVGFEVYLRMLDDAVRRLREREGEAGAARLQPADVSLDQAAYFPDDYIPSQEAKLDLYKRLSLVDRAEAIEAMRAEVRDRFGVLPTQAQHVFTVATLRLLGGRLGIETILVHGEEARITFREHAVPRLRAISAAFGEVQFRADVRRAHPLSLKLTRLGGSAMLDGLVRALREIASPTMSRQPERQAL
jgi:transcription-repair coupling factor (superfamily II helicase)